MADETCADVTSIEISDVADEMLAALTVSDPEDVEPPLDVTVHE